MDEKGRTMALSESNTAEAAPKPRMYHMLISIIFRLLQFCIFLLESLGILIKFAFFPISTITLLILAVLLVGSFLPPALEDTHGQCDALEQAVVRINSQFHLEHAMNSNNLFYKSIQNGIQGEDFRKNVMVTFNRVPPGVVCNLIYWNQFFRREQFINAILPSANPTW